MLSSLFMSISNDKFKLYKLTFYDIYRVYNFGPICKIFGIIDPYNFLKWHINFNLKVFINRLFASLIKADSHYFTAIFLFIELIFETANTKPMTTWESARFCHYFFANNTITIMTVYFVFFQLIVLYKR